MSTCLPTKFGGGRDLEKNKTQEHQHSVHYFVGEERGILMKITGLITGIAHVSLLSSSSNPHPKTMLAFFLLFFLQHLYKAFNLQMQGIAIKIFVHDFQARESKWLRNGLWVGIHFQDLVQVQLHQQSQGSYLFSTQLPLPEHYHSCQEALWLSSCSSPIPFFPLPNSLMLLAHITPFLLCFLTGLVGS